MDLELLRNVPSSLFMEILFKDLICHAQDSLSNTSPRH